MGNSNAGEQETHGATTHKKQAWTVITANGTSCDKMLGFLDSSAARNADAILGQELHIAGDWARAAEDKLRAQGWHACIVDAVPSASCVGKAQAPQTSRNVRLRGKQRATRRKPAPSQYNTTTGGLLVAAGGGHRLRSAQQPCAAKMSLTIVPGRAAAAAAFSGICKGGVLLVNVYLICSIAMGQRNLDILHKIAELVVAYGWPFIIAGDFQNSPGALKEWAAAIGGCVVAAGASTCKQGGREIDFFIVSKSLAAKCKADVLDGTGLAPHTPIKLTVVADQEAKQVPAFKLVCPKAFPRERPIGPCLPGADWHAVRESIAQQHACINLCNEQRPLKQLSQTLLGKASGHGPSSRQTTSAQTLLAN